MIKYVEFAERRCNELLAVVMTDENLYKSAEALEVEWRYSLAMCQARTKRPLLVADELRKRVHHECMMLVEKVALYVEKKTPRYDHVAIPRHLSNRLQSDTCCRALREPP